MDEVRIISIAVLIVIGILAIILYSKFKESKNYNKLKKINSLDIIEDEENQSLQFEKEEERKIIGYYVNLAYRGLDELYMNNSWENKRVLYSIISSISELRDDIEFNKLNENDMEMINSLICIYRANRNKKRNLENIIFEWQEKYIE
ncbi:MAG: hypothetical protein ACLR3R_04675 [Clostridium paraputrificum]